MDRNWNIWKHRNTHYTKNAQFEEKKAFKNQNFGMKKKKSTHAIPENPAKSDSPETPCSPSDAPARRFSSSSTPGKSQLEQVVY